jgi:hypothetical protein
MPFHANNPDEGSGQVRVQVQWKLRLDFQAGLMDLQNWLQFMLL